ncbi:tat pathway signal sequence [Nocardia stercoris]|uniref:Tat pathway signal sequence n=1 Tax=Nocardia stercoris TaxID=2483361 RepID=A0A3M2L906_9NOCA|nr:tat pathway signal sequence [Nocardia stercoris]
MATQAAAVDAYLATRPGTIGYVVRDRVTGALYRNAAADTRMWTASTIKLAIAVDLLQRARAGALTLTPADRERMDAMLVDSDNDATDALWDTYSGPDRLAFDNDFPRYGMTGLVAEPSSDRAYPYWGFEQCTPADLDRLMNTVLTGIHPDDRAYLLDRMRNVGPDQRWGMWGAGPDMRPGVKNGWSEEDSGWVTNSVGFAGPGERYTLAIMNSLGPDGGFDDGSQTTTQVAEILFGDQS